jgi:hypothetical protein
LIAPRVGVTWIDPLGVREDVVTPANTLAYEPVADGGFSLRLFAPPPAAALSSLPAGSTGPTVSTFAFGEIVVYQDVDGDGAYRIAGPTNDIAVPDEYRGGGGDVALIYVAKTAAADASPLALREVLSGAIGYHVASIDCSLAVPSAVDASSSVPLRVYLQQAASPALLYSRTCLRSHYVPITGP